MKAVLDHIGIAVKDLTAALAFYRDALGLEIEAPEDVASQRVRDDSDIGAEPDGRAMSSGERRAVRPTWLLNPRRPYGSTLAWPAHGTRVSFRFTSSTSERSSRTASPSCSRSAASSFLTSSGVLLGDTRPHGLAGQTGLLDRRVRHRRCAGTDRACGQQEQHGDQQEEYAADDQQRRPPRQHER